MNYSMYIAQELFSLWGKYDVTNEQGNLLYHVKGEASFFRRQNVYNASGQHVGLIEQKFSWLIHKFEIFEYGESKGTIESSFRLIGTDLNMNYFGWSVKGNWTGWNYDVYDSQNNLIASIRRELWHLSDHYAIHYSRKEDALSLLLLALAIDCITDDRSAAAS